MDELIKTIESSDAFRDGGIGYVILSALAIIVITIIVDKIAVRLAKKFYTDATDANEVGSMFNYIIHAAVYGCGLYMVFKNCFNIDLTVLAGALGITGLALSLGLQDTIKNILAGIQITFTKEVNIGDWIVCGGVDGEVKDVHIRNTTLVDDSNNTHIIPNSVLYSTTISRKPDYFMVPITITLSRDFILKEHGPAICKLVDENFAALGMQHPEKRTAMREVGTNAQGLECLLIAFGTWSFATSQVKTAAMEPTIAYLQEHGLLATFD